MSDSKIIFGWWARELGDRQSSAARGLAARLRRAGPVDALTERAVHELAQALGLGRKDDDGVRLAFLVRLLAEMREHVPQSLPRRLGGAEPVMSELRFQRLMRASGDDVSEALRRAITLVARRCNVALLSGDLLHWGEEVRRRWCFDYYGVDAPQGVSKEISE
jgi:CRISPR system Cascade subunit CasB